MSDRSAKQTIALLESSPKYYWLAIINDLVASERMQATEEDKAEIEHLSEKVGKYETAMVNMLLYKNGFQGGKVNHEHALIGIVGIGVGAVLALMIATSVQDVPRTTRWEDMNFHSELVARQNCEKNGGSVIRSSWDGRMTDCVIPR